MTRRATERLIRVVSLNVGLPRKVNSNGHEVITGIFKEPVAGRVMLRRLNLDGDRQADLTVHGGVNKAVYAYPSEHYSYWREQLPSTELPWGAFGENLTTEGLREDEVHIGDRLRVGSALLTVTQPRLPCFKLGLKFGLDDMPKRFLLSQRTGFYLAVVKEGEVRAGDIIALEHRERKNPSVLEMVHLYRT
jgi:MOSC domain-containing protein YiiM